MHHSPGIFLYVDDYLCVDMQKYTYDIDRVLSPPLAIRFVQFIEYQFPHTRNYRQHGRLEFIT